MCSEVVNVLLGADKFNASITCTPPAIEDFPNDIFSADQRLKGAVAIHIIASLYLFVALAIVCDKYFVPAVVKLCKALNMSNDVAGATFMAVATSAPELFVNVIGTFITEGDIGVGTIVGSAVFNILAIAACCGVFAVKAVPLHWWPLTRDCVAYGITVTMLICIIHDEVIYRYEALVLVLTYTLYIAVMYWDKNIQKFFCVEMKENESESENNGSEIQSNNENNLKGVELVNINISQNGNIVKQHDENEDKEESGILHWLSFPFGKSWIKVLIWTVTAPIYLVFGLTVPDCERKRFENWFALTFIMCIVWIGSLSYLVSWMITIIGDTLTIPDSVMGITFLAAGTSVPEAVSSVIVAKQGRGSMGISNSLGSNTFDILLCLGLPWFIKATFLPSGENHNYVNINSRGLEYNAISLLSTLLLFYVVFALNKFKLDRKVGLTCLFMYIIFVVFATLIELNVFFVVNLPTCQKKS
ncbi:hypothetical protein V9T40_012488 [Parthenolecanium corni]|uniref:Sodium/potassium/calcium exchanger 5 n=1 Tax=Parthenolecanium corni TaxID=536013 RepID=A0AAN9T7A9_9HEMI